MCLLGENLVDLFNKVIGFAGLIWSIFLIGHVYWSVYCKACRQEWTPRRHLWWEWAMCLDYINHFRFDCQQKLGEPM